MPVRFVSTLLLVAFLSLAPIPAGAASLQECGLKYVLPPPSSSKDPVVLTFRGQIDYCSSIRVAAVGEAAALGLPLPSSPGGFSVILAIRIGAFGPDTNCPAVVVPFEVAARLPELLEAVRVPGIMDIPVFLRTEDPNGMVLNQVSCGAIGWGGTEEGYRKKVFLEGGFTATATWQTPTETGDAFAVPAETVRTDSALFWFFDPKNWEVTFKVLDACAVNDHYWVLGSAATDVGFTLRINRSETGDTWEHTNPGGTLARAFVDVNAFACTGD